jgi:glutathione S-transferase
MRWFDASPQGNVPAVQLADGTLLTESVAVLQWIADQAPAAGLAPAPGTVERHRLVEWLAFVSTELHKKHLWMIFSAKTPEPVRAWARSSAGATLDHLAAHLAHHEYLLGARFSVADAYLYWALFVAPHGGIDLSAWPELGRYVERVGARPAARQALALEGPLYLDEAKAGAAPAAVLPA